MSPQAPNATPPAPASGEPGYQVDDLIIDLGSAQVRRAGTVVPLPTLSFDLLVALARAAPNLLSFEQLSERVWPSLMATPETIIQRVKLVRNALGDDPQAPRYIEAVRGRGYRMVAHVSPLGAKHCASESVDRLEHEKNPEVPSAHTSATGASRLSPRAWMGGALIILALLAVSLAVVYYRGASKRAARMSSGAVPSIQSLAVLPLENLSGDKEQEYFADGMTDALTTDLAQIGSLRVISRTSAMHFKGSKETLPQIGHDLQVDAVVEGTVARSENRVRVTAQLIEASSDRHLWAKTYERDLKNVLALQDAIAQDITEQVRVKLTPQERSLLMQVRSVDPEAYEAALRGWYWWNQPSVEGMRKARDYFQKAIAKDPSYALAYAGLAESFLFSGFGGDFPRDEAVTRAREAALKALALDPSLAAAHAALADIRFWNDWDWAGTEAEYQQAIALSPNYATAHRSYSFYLLAMGRLDESMKEIERARDLDPFSQVVTYWLGQVLYHARRYDDALRQNQRGSEMYPGNPDFYWAMADVYEQKKIFAKAFAARQQTLTLNKDPTANALAEAYKRSGYRGYLLKQAQILEQAHSINQPYIGHLYALLGDESRAMSALEEAYNAHIDGVLFMRTAPELDSIRSSARFRDLVRRIGFPPSPGARN
jgi:TolB-like protein/DNA-binding winged helix-turn-helix (wHTH) protein/Tfp pilus assembly protein PilF